MALNPCDGAFLSRLAGLIPEGTLTAPEPRWLEEPRGRWTGQAGAVARPRNTAEVATIIRACAADRVPIVPFGGGTGLVGGQTKPDAPIPLIVSLERMQATRGIWPKENVVAVEAGMKLATLHEVAAGAGRFFPLSLASEGSATIGGNLATNAGGTAVLRYGSARELCLGIEAVLPDGSILNGLKRLRKDNSGYAIKDLLVGSEGSLGIITAASLRLFPQPVQRLVACLSVPSPKAAQELLQLSEERFTGLVSGFELISGVGLEFLIETGPEVQSPFADVPEWAVLIEIGLPPILSMDEAGSNLVESATAKGLVRDGVIAISEAQARALWHLRESIPVANRCIGAIASHDISLPLDTIPDFIAKTGTQLASRGDFRVNCFGHLGDGNLHYNIFPARGRRREEYDDQRHDLTRLVHDNVAEMDGSISAEHGIGRLRVADAIRYGDPARLGVMRAIKKVLDPHGIMNPGVVLSADG